MDPAEPRPNPNALPLTRRELFVRAGGLLVAGAAGAVAHAIPATALATKAPAYSALLVSADLYASPQPQRIGFVVAQGNRFVSGPSAKVSFAPTAHGVGNTPLTTSNATLYDHGLPRGRGVYVANVVFDVAGIWTGVVRTRGRNLKLPMEVKEKNEAPAVGQAVPRVPSPTTANPLGVKPLCTRSPACPLHSVSLDTVLGTKPVVAMFATPVLCQTAYCGPVLNELLALVPKYQDRATFVHVEIYKDTKATALAPTVDTWNLPSDPWLFAIDATGTARERLDGAIGRDEMEKAIKSVI